MTSTGLGVALRVAVVLLSAAALQRGLFAEVRIGGASLDVLLLLAVVGGMVLGPDRGAVLGFFAGLTLDLLAQLPLGLSALTYCMVGWAGGRLYGATMRSSRVLGLLLVAGLSAAAVAVYAVAAEVLGRDGTLGTHLVAVLVVVVVGNVVLSPLARRVVRWAWPADEGIRPALR